MKYLQLGRNNGTELKWRVAKTFTGNSFDALLTFDKNLQHQQNFLKYTITVFVLTAQINQLNTLKSKFLLKNQKTNIKNYTFNCSEKWGSLHRQELVF